jgi:hypothetical protein
MKICAMKAAHMCINEFLPILSHLFSNMDKILNLMLLNICEFGKVGAWRAILLLQEQMKLL